MADEQNWRVRRIKDGIISTVVGNGNPAYNGDGLPAGQTQLAPRGLAVDEAGDLFIADRDNHRIRKLANDGLITTVVGTGTEGGDGGPATAAQLVRPAGISVSPAGDLYIADDIGHRVRKVSGGTIGSIGSGWQSPIAVIADDYGNVYVNDYGTGVASAVGTIFTGAGLRRVADGFTEILLGLNRPTGLAMDAKGSLYIADASDVYKYTIGDQLRR